MSARGVWLVCAALIVQIAGGVSASPAAADTQSSPVGGSAAQDAALSPEARASGQSAASGQPVGVSAETTPTQLVTANPDGTFTAETSPEPVRVKQGADWVPVDTDLRTDPSGLVVPKAAAANIAFSGGGSSDPLARIENAGRDYTVRSPWKLPAPVLSGATATYADVLAGVDLVVAATTDGFSENLVLKTRAAADDTGLATVRFPVSLNGIAVHDTGTGGAALVDNQGRPVFTTGTALMYDSSPAVPQPATARAARTAEVAGEDEGSVVDGPDPSSKTSVMDVSVTSEALTVTPDQQFLKDPETTFPVVLDPQTTSSSLSGWTTAWSNVKTTSFWKTSHALGVGYDAYVDNKIAYSFYQFDTHALGGKKVLSATFNALEVWSANCSKKAVELWRTGSISSSTTYAHQPAWSEKVDSVDAAKGYSSSCPGGNVSFDATKAVSYTAGKSSASTTLGLRAASNSDAIAWKQFASPSDHKPTLSVTFVSKPSTPTSLKLSDPQLACGASSSVAVNIRSLTPSLSATVQSADGSQSTLRPNFELYRYDPDVADPKAASGSPSAWTTDGKAGTWKTPVLKNGETYWIRARTEYHYSFNGTSASMYSGWSKTGACAFHIDTSKPDAPTVSSTDYPGCATSDDPDQCTAHGGVGAPGTFTVKAADTDVVKFTYTLNDGKQVTKAVPSGTTSTALSLAPDARDLNQLTVTAWDAAGNSSASQTYYFEVAPGAPPTGTWSFDEGSGSAAADSAGAHPATLVGGAGWSTRARLGTALDTDGTSGYAAATGTGLDTSKSFTVSGWARLTDASHNAVVAAQAGTKGSSFALYYSTSYKAWIFNRYTADSATPTIVRSVSTTVPAVNVWTHLTGVYDAQAQTIQLYVNGVPQGDAVAFTTPWKATGSFEIARGQYGAAYSDYFPGQIDEIQMWNRVLSTEEAADLEAETDPGSGAARPSLAAEWNLDESTGSTAADASGYGHTATVDSGGAWKTDDEGGKGSVLSVNGSATGNASASGPVIDSQGDFTISAWAQLDPASLSDTSVSHTMAVAGQSGSKRDSWGLWYQQPAGLSQGMWVFGRTMADSTGADVVSVPANVASAQLVDPGDWTMLTGVYDGAHHQLYLYVNGVRQGAQGDTDTDDDTGDGIVFDDPWQATGTFSIGRGRTAGGSFGNYPTGLIDEVRIWTGVMSAPDIDQLYLNEVPVPL
ncbi:LamG-like jellyroll fold domain-containing protein [Streptomyces sp. NBC_00455]|uniref:LamG-like jellyroll fold domain-containing protein n=1 Tax=Streptomyces sp. NBC_00455 TaxID=2903654 RepID=UPI002E2386CB